MESRACARIRDPTDYSRIIEEIIPFKLVQYKEADQNITDAAIADLNFGDASGKLMVVEQKDGSKKVLYVPDKKI